jgi:rod shape-determining protein MreD
MAWLRAVLAAALVLSAVLIQLTVLPWLRLPGSTPDLVTVTIVALGFVGGPVRGAVTGLLAGVLLDLVPPADGVIGLTAVVLVAVGYLAGLSGSDRERSPFAQVGIAAALAGLVVVGLGFVGMLVGDDRVAWDRVLPLVATQMLYALVLAAFVVPFVGWLWRRVDPPAPRYDVARP